MGNTNDSTSNYQRVIDLQIELEELEGVAKLAGDACDDGSLAGTFGVIERRAEAIGAALNGLIDKPTPRSRNIPFRAFDRLSDAKQAAGNIESVCSTAPQDPDIPEVTRGLFRTIESQVTALDVALDGCEVELQGGAVPESASDGRLSPQATLQSFNLACSNLSAQECAMRLRAFLCDVSDNIAADQSEDDYTIRYTCTLKGLRSFLAEQEFWNSLQDES